MSAPACTCSVEVDMHRGQGRVILCPLHLAAEDLYERLEGISAAFNHMMDYPHPEHPEMFTMRLEILLRGIPNLLTEARGESEPESDMERDRR